MHTILLAVLLLLSGCSTLLIHEWDGPLTITGKVAARVPLALVTFAMSEVAFRQEAERLAYEDWYHSLSERDQDREDRRRQNSAPIIIVSPQPYRFYQLPMRGSR